MEKLEIIWSRRATKNLEEIQDYIALDDPLAADAFLDRIEEMVDGLLDYPKIGRIVPELRNETFRERIYGHYRIIYRLEPGIIEIITVHHCARRFPTDI
ncbi:MAG: type II toxin-antitoxin system RelE/ParE family toxin [Candidatus Eremiobacteraeota bacterium]|nr:type II toxin-antitoxin system RelE/ParE family toxin [Candidatus Eremiobacteraeota bacterium]